MQLDAKGGWGLVVGLLSFAMMGAVSAINRTLALCLGRFHSECLIRGGEGYGGYGGFEGFFNLFILVLHKWGFETLAST